jgi:hypothetical protein
MAPATGIVFNRIGTVYLLAAALLSSGYLAGFNGILLSLSRECQFRELCTSSSPSVSFGASLTCISSLIVTPDRCAQSECDAQTDSINSVVQVLLMFVVQLDLFSFSPDLTCDVVFPVAPRLRI